MTNAEFYEKYEPLKMFCGTCGTESEMMDDEEIYCPKCETIANGQETLRSEE